MDYFRIKQQATYAIVIHEKCEASVNFFPAYKSIVLEPTRGKLNGIFYLILDAATILLLDVMLTHSASTKSCCTRHHSHGVLLVEGLQFP